MTAKQRRSKHKDRTRRQRYTKMILRNAKNPRTKWKRPPRWRAYQREARKTAARLYKKLTTPYWI